MSHTFLKTTFLSALLYLSGGQMAQASNHKPLETFGNPDAPVSWAIENASHARDDGAVCVSYKTYQATKTLNNHGFKTYLRHLELSNTLRTLSNQDELTILQHMDKRGLFFSPAQEQLFFEHIGMPAESLLTLLEHNKAFIKRIKKDETLQQILANWDDVLARDNKDEIIETLMRIAQHRADIVGNGLADDSKANVPEIKLELSYLLKAPHAKYSDNTLTFYQGVSTMAIYDPMHMVAIIAHEMDHHKQMTQAKNSAHLKGAEKTLGEIYKIMAAPKYYNTSQSYETYRRHPLENSAHMTAELVQLGLESNEDYQHLYQGLKKKVKETAQKITAYQTGLKQQQKRNRRAKIKCDDFWIG